jgi:hypothetical protein
VGEQPSQGAWTVPPAAPVPGGLVVPDRSFPHAQPTPYHRLLRTWT